ncbi:MAG: vWA domain-containing protein [Thermofilaceae archaeon]
MAWGFEHPEAMVLVSLVLPVFLILLKTRNNKVRLKQLFELNISRLNLGFEALRVAALLVLIFTAAVPYYEYTVKRQVQLEQVDQLSENKVLHVVLLDVSRSITYSYGSRTRFDVAIEALKRYFSSLTPNDHVHLAVFSSSVRSVCDGLPVDCLKALDGLTAGERFTALGDSLLYALSISNVADLPAVVVLVSDGMSNYGSDPLQVATLFKSKGLPMMIISIGGQGIIPQVTEAAGAEVYVVNEFTIEAIESLAAKAAREARYNALLAKGEAYIEEVRRSYEPARILSMIALFLAFSALVDGV